MTQRQLHSPNWLEHGWQPFKDGNLQCIAQPEGGATGWILSLAGGSFALNLLQAAQTVSAFSRHFSLSKECHLEVFISYISLGREESTIPGQFQGILEGIEMFISWAFRIERFTSSKACSLWAFCVLSSFPLKTACCFNSFNNNSDNNSTVSLKKGVSVRWKVLLPEGTVTKHATQSHDASSPLQHFLNVICKNILSPVLCKCL